MNSQARNFFILTRLLFSSSRFDRQWHLGSCSCFRIFYATLHVDTVPEPNEGSFETIEIYLSCQLVTGNSGFISALKYTLKAGFGLRGTSFGPFTAVLSFHMKTEAGTDRVLHSKRDRQVPGA